VTKRSKWPKYNTRGPLHGTCNICGGVGPLTDDHVPPKGCPRISTVRMHQLYELLTAGKLSSSARQAQGGVKFRTICAKCNNTLLGAEYDPALIHVAKEIDQFLSALNAGVVIPGHTSVRVKPQRLMRAVVGHLLAADVGRRADGPWDGPLAQYFLDQSRPLPSDAHIYYWLYPYRQQLLTRDAVYLSLASHDKGKDSTYFMLLKFFPLAFMICDGAPNCYRFNLPSLTMHGALPIDGEVEMPVYFKSVRHELWPEAPTEQHVILYGGNPLFAKAAR